MSRTLGARDLKKRKVSGYKNRWKKYHKKHKRKTRKTRSGNLVPYKSKRDRNAPVKVWFWEVRPMRKEKINNFPLKSRAKMRKIVYLPYIRYDANPSEISTPESLGNTALKVIGHDGEFIMKMFGHAKNKHHCTARQVARVIIRNTPTGLMPFVEESWRISRYWFWKK